jgi:hypothetical protein
VYRNYIRNKTLIDLNETPQEVKDKIAAQYSNYVLPRQNVMNYLVEKRCRLLLEDIPAFIG